MNIGWRSLKSPLLLVCIGLCIVGCQKESQKVQAPEAEKGPAASLQRVEPVKEEAPAPIPVQREDVRLTGFMIGTGLDAHNEIKNPSSKFHAGDLINAIVRTDGSGPDATIKVICKDSAGAILFEEHKTITPNGSDVTPFTLSSAKTLSSGEYHLQALLDDYPAMGVSFTISQ